MDTVTKVFLVNQIVMWSTAAIDRNLLDDALEDIAPTAFGIWCVLSMISVPAYLIWLVV